MEYALHEIVDMPALRKLLDGLCLIGAPACFVAGGDGAIAAQAGPLALREKLLPLAREAAAKCLRLKLAGEDAPLGASGIRVVRRAPALVCCAAPVLAEGKPAAAVAVGFEALGMPDEALGRHADFLRSFLENLMAAGLTARRAAERAADGMGSAAGRALMAEREKLRVTLRSIGDGVIATDAEGLVTLMNGMAETLTGWTADKAAGRPFAEVFQVFDEATGEAAKSPVELALAAGKPVPTGFHTLRGAEGEARAVSDSASPVLDETGRALGAVLVFRDVTDAKKKESEIAYLSYHDVLTGLYNRAFFDEEARRLDTERQLPISVIMGDVNGLKLTNDVFGHTEGDNLLKRIANILKECCRNEDIVARVGGDEFCILLPSTPYGAASDICRRIYARCEKVDGSLPGGSAKLSISLGCAAKTEGRESIRNVMKAAEDAMYRRKLLESRSQHTFLISSIRSTLFEKSFEPERHAQRLIANTRAMAGVLGLPEDQLGDMELFALLHDIGKIAIDSRILTKPGALSDAEWSEVRKHPEVGFRIAQSSPDLAHIAEYILCHHERWDGAGYPQGLRGTSIPLLARIFLVADAYDAMTQDKVYRRALGRDTAFRELIRNAGAQFDPNIVWVFLELLDRGTVT
jgi:diguanylate cyclase (GGDEF)-like protein/PAS domain S-box-containing protein